jgi:hypothetical protein
MFEKWRMETATHRGVRHNEQEADQRALEGPKRSSQRVFSTRESSKRQSLRDHLSCGEDVITERSG